MERQNIIPFNMNRSRTQINRDERIDTLYYNDVKDLHNLQVCNIKLTLSLYELNQLQVTNEYLRICEIDLMNYEAEGEVLESINNHIKKVIEHPPYINEKTKNIEDIVSIKYITSMYIIKVSMNDKNSLNITGNITTYRHMKRINSIIKSCNKRHFSLISFSTDENCNKEILAEALVTFSSHCKILFSCKHYKKIENQEEETTKKTFNKSNYKIRNDKKEIKKDKEGILVFE